MPQEQLRLFPGVKPLRLRFGDQFFKQAPRCAGVYVMTGRSDRVLYVGQSGNLRKRLAFYKNADLTKSTGKLRRLIAEVQSITWEMCRDATQARLRENEMLRLHEPRHNVANARARSYLFVSTRIEGGILRLALGTQKATEAQNRYGAFKARGATIAAVAGLARLLWIVAEQPASIFDVPSRLLKNRMIREDTFELQASFPCLDKADAEYLIHNFLEGLGDELVIYLQAAISEWVMDRDPFTRGFVDADLEKLSHFYATGPLRNTTLRTEHGLPATTISRSEIDDLLVLSSARRIHDGKVKSVKS